MKRFTSMAYSSADEMMFGTAKNPVATKRGLTLGGGHVIPEIVPHPRPGSEKSLKILLREFERANGDALERCVFLGHPTLMIESEHIFQMTNNPSWGGEIAAQIARQLDEYHEKYGLKAACRATVADLRKPDLVHLRDSEQTRKVLDSFKECARFADILSIESLGGKEITDYSIIRNDVVGMLFGQGVLGGLDMEWLWTRIVDIAQQYDCIAGGDTDCAQANTAMFLAGGLVSKDVPHTLAALALAMAGSRTLVAQECGAVGPGKDCGYENPIVKAISGIPITTEGKACACAHADLCGNVIAAVCDLWSNEAVEYHNMFGGSTSAVFTEILGYDAAAMNTAVELGYQKEYQACLVNSDRYRGPHGFVLCPDNSWKIGKAIVDHRESLYQSTRAAAMTCGELMLGDPLLKLTVFETESLQGYMRDLEALPGSEADFIDLCLHKYSKVKGFNPSSYGL